MQLNKIALILILRKVDLNMSAILRDILYITFEKLHRALPLVFEKMSPKMSITWDLNSTHI